MSNNFTNLVLCFAFYSMFGWICETIYCSVGAGRLVPRGFLKGPICPIYGFGAIAVLSFVEPYLSRPVALFFMAFIVTSVLEYFTSWLQDTLFGYRWFDYSTYRFNLKGRICLRNSTLYGLMALFVSYVLHPRAVRWFGSISATTKDIAALLFLIIVTVDVIYSVNRARKIPERKRNLKKLS